MKKVSFVIAGILFLLASPQDGKTQTLEEVLEDGLKSNPEAKQVLYRFKSTQQKIDEAKANYWPSVNIAGGIGAQKQDSPTSIQEEPRLTRKEASFSIKQNLFSGFETINEVQKANKDSEAERWRSFSALNDIALKIINAYLEVLEKEELLELTEDNYQIHLDTYELIKKRTDQGVSNLSELIEVKGKMARANANLVSSINNYHDSLSIYKKLVGTVPDNLTPPSSINLQLPNNLREALYLALKEHPSIKAADLDIESAEHAYSSQRSNLLPSIDFEIDRSWKTNADGNEGTLKDSTAMLRLRYNLFNGGNDTSKIQEMAYQVEERRSRRNQAVRDVEERIRIAWSALHFTSEQKIHLLEHEESTRSTVQAYEEQFNIGKRSIVDLLEINNELFQSSNSLTTAIYEEAYAKYRILSATGILLETLKLVSNDEWE